MLVNRLKTRVANLCRRVPLLARFVKHQDGAVAIEFGLVLAPFLLLLFMIMETALVFFAGQTLETAAADSARLIKTGQAQAQGPDPAKFKEAVCARIYGLFDCENGMIVDVKSYPQFSSISGSAVPVDPVTGEPQTRYEPGEPGEIVVLTLMYKWTITVTMTQAFLGNQNGKTARMLTSTVAFRNEPYK